jgi:hypothetical protein
MPNLVEIIIADRKKRYAEHLLMPVEWDVVNTLEVREA